MDALANVIFGFILFLLVGIPLLAILLAAAPSILKKIFYALFQLFTGKKGTFKERRIKSAYLLHRDRFVKSGFEDDIGMWCNYPHEYHPENPVDNTILQNCFHVIILDKKRKMIYLGSLRNSGKFLRFSTNDVIKFDSEAIAIRNYDWISKGFYISFFLKSGDVARFWVGLNQNKFDELRLSISLLASSS